MNSEFYDHVKAKEIIKSYCRKEGINEADLAAVIGIQPASLSRIKAGKGCSVEVLAKIAVLGGVSIKELLFDTSSSAIRQMRDQAAKSNLSLTI